MKVNGKWGNLTPSHPKTPKPMVTKICVGNYVGDIYHRAKFYPNRFRGFGSAHGLLGRFYRYAKFGWNRCSTFDNIKVLIFCAFGLKTPFHAPKIGVLEGYDSVSREQH